MMFEKGTFGGMIVMGGKGGAPTSAIMER